MIIKNLITLIDYHLGLHIPSLVEKNILSLEWSLSNNFLMVILVSSSNRAMTTSPARASNQTSYLG
jgi:hypothetical protein